MKDSIEPAASGPPASDGDHPRDDEKKREDRVRRELSCQPPSPARPRFIPAE
jgi:hypothetical protein